MKKLLSMAILLALSWSSIAATPSGPCNNTFVKQVTGIGNLEPRIFKDPASANFYLTSADNSSAYISGVNAAGTLTWTHNIKFMGDVGVIKDLVVDQIDGTLAGIVRGNNFNYVFKYNYVTASFSWLKRYPSNYLFMNIHQEAAGNYIVTGAILSSNITIFEVDRVTGAFGSYQNQGNPFTGEFFSTYDGNNIYGACRYYSSGGLFNPSLYEFTPSGINTWVSTYVQNTAAPTARIYPVAPIVDKVSNNILQLSSGADAAFNTYQTGPTKIWLLQTDMAGNLNWTREMIIPGYKQPNVKQIINTATGYYLLTDVYNGSIEDYFFVIKTDKNGKVQWSNRYGINGLNTVISGVESGGYLYLTALSQSYTTATGILFLKLNPSGMSDAACPYIRPWNVYDQSYTNTQVNKPTGEAPTGFSNVNHTASISNLVATDKVQCATTCPTVVPCSSLTGSLATGVMAFYPFGGGSLNDFSGNGNNLSNPTSAFPVPDRISTPNCAYRFNKGSGDYLTIPAAGSAFLNGMTSSGFSVSLWYQPLGTRPAGDYELLVGRNTGLHCPDTWGEWSVGLYDCRKAVVGFDQYSHWQNVTGCASVMAAMSNSWHHLSFVYDPTMPPASQYSLYIDGTLFSNSGGPCGPMSANLGPLLLGADYTGDLDDVIMYNRSLSPSEVMALYHLNTSCCGGGTSTMLPCNTLPGPLASNVMAFYPFGNGSLLDLSGNGNNLNNSTSAYATADRSGNPTCAYHFERTLGDFLDGPGTYFDNITSGTFSVSLWYQPTYDPTRGPGDYELLLGRGNTGLHCPDTWGEWSAGLYDCRQAVVGFDQLSHWESNPARCAAFAAGTPMGWHHLAFVYDPSSSSPYILYIDGTPYMNSHGPCGPMSGNIGQLMLGVDYTGDLDDVIIYNKALTVADVTALISLNGSCCDGISSSAKKAPLEKASDLKVYPNPTDGKIAVTSTKGMIRQINVYTNTGVLAGTYTFDAAAVTVNLDQLAPGIYFMKVTTDEGTFTEKVVRQ